MPEPPRLQDIDRRNVFVDDGNDVEIQMERRVNNHVARHEDAGVVRVDFIIIIIIKLLLLVLLLLICIRVTFNAERCSLLSGLGHARSLPSLSL
jgi:hypothetical protein